MTPKPVVERYGTWIRAVALVAAVVLPVVSTVQSGAAQSGAPARGRGWSTVMGDLANRYSTLDQINTQTVSKLGAAWMSERLNPAGNTRSMTAIKDGMIYFTAPPAVLKMDAAPERSCGGTRPWPPTRARGGGAAAAPGHHR